MDFDMSMLDEIGKRIQEARENGEIESFDEVQKRVAPQVQAKFAKSKRGKRYKYIKTVVDLWDFKG